MRYLITGSGEPFLTTWYDVNHHWKNGMIVFDLTNQTYTENGIDWMPIERDSL